MNLDIDLFNKAQTYEEKMIMVAQCDSNKKHCMDYAIDLAEKADAEISTLKAKIADFESYAPDVIRRECAEAAIKWLDEHPCSHSQLLYAAIMSAGKE